MERPFEKMTVVGTGTLGAQIALLAANAGYQVTICDVRPGAFQETYRNLRSDLEAKGVEPFIPWDRLDALSEAVKEVTDLAEAVRDTEFVVEAVPENLEIKQKVFSEIGRKAPPEAIFATNSSSMPVSYMEESTGRPEKCLNTHFYMILQGMNMADVMGGTRTAPDVMQKGVAWVNSMGCIPLTVKKELLGFCFNRVWHAIKREVLWMWGNGYVDFRNVDRAWMTFTKMGIGPFGLMDTVGLDVIYDIEMVYFKESGIQRDMPPQSLKEMVDRGELGVKSGKGFYTYPDPEFRRPEFLKSSNP
jgi:3-hydroxybutyryl-CoA dehydrogenase